MLTIGESSLAGYIVQFHCLENINNSRKKLAISYFYHGVKVLQQALCSKSLNLHVANKPRVCNALRVYFALTSTTQDPEYIQQCCLSLLKRDIHLKRLEVKVAASSKCNMLMYTRLVVGNTCNTWLHGFT